MTRHLPLRAGLTLLLEAVHAVIDRIECGVSGHDWVAVPRGWICRCCLAERRG